MRIVKVVIACFALALVGCGESIEHKLEQAKISLSSGRPDAALKYAQDVLAQRPGDAVAKLLSAKAHLRLRHYEDSRKLLSELLKDEPSALEARRELLNLALAEMTDLLSASEFTTNPALDERFTEAKTLGHEQADWFGSVGKEVAVAEFARARLVLLDSQRIGRILREEEARLRGTQGLIDPNTPVSSPAIEEMRRNIKSMHLTVERHAEATLFADAAHFQAASLLVRLLHEREAWGDLWVFAGKMQQRTDLPVQLAADLVGEVLNMPDRLYPPKARLETSRALLAAVTEQGRQSVQWKNIRARLHLREGEKEQAMKLAQEVFRAQPADPEVRLTYGWVLYEHGQYPQAKTILENLASDRRDHEHVQMLHGMTLDKLGERTLAVEALRRVTAINPGNQVARTALVKILAENQDTVTVVMDDINKLYAANPADPEVIRFKFTAELAAGNMNNVKALIEAVKKLSPHKPGHLRVLVDGSVLLKDTAAALDYARATVEMDRNNEESHLGLARVHVLRGELEQARKVLVDVRQQFPQSMDVNHTLAMLYVNQGAFDRAIALLEEQLKVNPEDVDARLVLAQAFIQLSLTEEALEQVQQVRERHPDDPRAIELAASIYRLLGQNDLAQAYLSKIDESRIDETRMPGVLAQLKLQKGDVAEAMAICNRAIAAGSTDPRVRLTLASIHSRANNSGEEEIHLIAYIRENPAQFVGYSMLARFYAKHNPERGVAQFKSMRQLNEVYARLFEATLLNSTGQHDEALRTLAEGYGMVVRMRHQSALGYARAMASIIVSRNGVQLEQLKPIYDSLINADLYATDARVAWVDLSWEMSEENVRIERLQDAAAKLKSSELSKIRKIADRFTRMNKPQLGLEVIDSWLAREPKVAALHRAKAEALTAALRLEEAVAAYEAALALTPDDVVLLDRLAAVHRQRNDFPMADNTFDRMAAIDTASRIRALWLKADLFTDLGLLEDAKRVIEELGKASSPDDPRVLFAMGQCMAGLEDVAGGRTRLSLVPRHSSQYGQAQISLAILDERAGDVAGARDRLEKLAADRILAADAIRALIETGVRHKDFDGLLKWSERALQLDRMDGNTRLNWLRIRTVAQASTGQFEGLRDTLEQTIALSNTPSNRAARLALMAYQGQETQARQLLASDASLLATEHGVLLALALSVPLQGNVQARPLTHYLAALMSGDAGRAAQAADALGAMNTTVYAGDLRQMASVLRIGSDEVKDNVRRMAVALVALETGLPPVTERIAAKVVEAQPQMTLAHAVSLAAAIAQEKPIDAIRKGILDRVPDSSLALFVQVQAATNERQWKAGAELAAKLLVREPNHDHVIYRLVTLLKLAGEHGKAMELVRQLAAGKGPYRDAAANDMAYQLSKQGPEQLSQAHAMAMDLRRRHPLDPNMADTMGWIELLRGEKEQAIRHLGFAALRMNRSAEVHYHLGRAYHETGQIVWARRHLELAARLGGSDDVVKEASQLLKTISDSRK